MPFRLRQTVSSRHRTSRYCQWLAAGLLIGIGGAYFSTDTFAAGDLHNQADYQANSISVGIGTNATAGTLNPAGMGFGNDSDSQASTTKAGISQVNITLTDNAKQKQLTGKDTTQTLAGLNRDVSTNKDSSSAFTTLSATATGVLAGSASGIAVTINTLTFKKQSR